MNTDTPSKQDADHLIVNGRKVSFVKYGKYQEIILWWALDGQVAKIQRPIPLPNDNYWAQWTVTFKGVSNVADGSADKTKYPKWPYLDKTEGILSPGQNLVFAPGSIINIVKTKSA